MQTEQKHEDPTKNTEPEHPPTPTEPKENPDTLSKAESAVQPKDLEAMENKGVRASLRVEQYRDERTATLLDKHGLTGEEEDEDTNVESGYAAAAARVTAKRHYAHRGSSSEE